MKKILVVDDAMFMRLTLKTMLEKNNFEVLGEADNGFKAIKLYEIVKPDIVIMDITMPQMGGLEALEQIIKMDAQAKVLMLSALGQEEKIKEAILLGAKGFVVKPFEEDYLIKALMKL